MSSSEQPLLSCVAFFPRGGGCSPDVWKHENSITKRPSRLLLAPTLLVQAEEGPQRALDAFVIALSKACEGGRKRWYASTLELQLASREMCGACRSVQTLNVCVNKHTPATLWSRLRSRALSTTHGSKSSLSSRVPVVRALRLTCELPMKTLVKRAAKELWAGLKVLHLRGSIPTGRIEAAVWPNGLQGLEFGDRFNQPIIGVAWPTYLQQLSFDGRFNQPIIGVEWPVSMQQLSFGYCFNQPIVGVVWPTPLQQISFDGRFNQPIIGVAWPTSLQQISFDGRFNQPIIGVLWPTSLQQLTFRGIFNQPIIGAGWPSSLQQLSLGDGFNQPIVGVVWPNSLKRLSFEFLFNEPLVGVVWPPFLEKLSFGAFFKQPIDGIVWPDSLTSITCDGQSLI